MDPNPLHRLRRDQGGRQHGAQRSVTAGSSGGGGAPFPIRHADGTFVVTYRDPQRGQTDFRLRLQPLTLSLNGRTLQPGELDALPDAARAVIQDNLKRASETLGMATAVWFRRPLYTAGCAAASWKAARR